MTDTLAKILVADDEPDLRALLQRYLSDQGYTVRTVEGAGPLDVLLARERFDVLVLDVMMPGEDGLSICRRLRAQGETIPILMLTARGDEPDKVAGLDAGADDYITKPFSTQELLARIRAVLRRRAPEQVAEPIDIGGLALDAATHRVSWQGQPLQLGPTEFKLLHYLMKHAERVHSRTQLLDKIWGDHVVIEERTVDVHVKRLREALGSASAMAETVRGAGYRFTAQPVLQNE